MLAIWYITKKRGASPLLVPRSIGLRIAPSVETSNAESPTPMYVYNTPYRTIRQTADDDILVRRYITPLGAFPLLCSWQMVWSCEVHRPSKPKRQLRLYLCICIPTLAQSWAFCKDYGCKDSDYFWKLYQKREKLSKNVVGRCLVGSKIVITSPLFVQK